MKKIKFSAQLMTLTAFLLMSSLCQAQDWQNLFNGKDLSGWFEVAGINGKHKWEVKDGMIIGTTVPGQANGFLVTEKEYGDFILELETSIDTLMNNSGIQVRSPSYPGFNNSRLHGYQIEIEPNNVHRSGAIYEEGGNRGWLYTADQLSLVAQKAFKNDTKRGYVWNKYRIEVIGNTIRSWVNGIPAAHLVDDKFLRGHIGMQIHANNASDPQGVFSIRFRNIRIQTGDLKPSPYDNVEVADRIPNHLSPQEEKNGFSLLWDGRSAKGWMGPNKSKFPEHAWSVKDGELSVIKPAGTEAAPYIISEKLYGPFELKFEYKLSEGSNSAVKYFAIESGSNTNAALSALGYQIVDNAVTGVTGSRTLGSLSDVMARPAPAVAAGGRGGAAAGVPGTGGALAAGGQAGAGAGGFGGAGRIRYGEWSQALIRVLPNNQVEYWLNGSKILEFKRSSAEFKELVAKSKYKDLPNFGMNSKGHIILENNGTPVSYRNIKIRELN